MQIVISHVKKRQNCIFALEKSVYKLYNIQKRTGNHNILCVTRFVLIPEKCIAFWSIHFHKTHNRETGCLVQPVLRVSGRFLRLLTAWCVWIEAATACRDVAGEGNGLIPSATLREWRIGSFRFDVCAGGRFLRLLTAQCVRIEAATACRDVADVGNGLIPSATFMFG